MKACNEISVLSNYEVRIQNRAQNVTMQLFYVITRSREVFLILIYDALLDKSIA
jgi:hypothetical protein